jgi:hypothetical protein
MKSEIDAQTSTNCFRKTDDMRPREARGVGASISIA